MTSPRTESWAETHMPIVGWAKEYQPAWLTKDVVAGVTLWGLVVPEGMAYAGLAGLPPEAGLYTVMVSLVAYAVLGSSRHLVVVATSATAALVASTVAALKPADVATYGAYAAALVLLVGVLYLLAGLAKLGFIAQFLSRPVMEGFVLGLAVFVAVGQLNKLFGVSKGHGNVPACLHTGAGAVGVHGVRTVAAVDGVVAAFLVGLAGVVPAVEVVVASAAAERVTDQERATAVQRVPVTLAEQPVVAGTALEHVGSGRAPDPVRAVGADNGRGQAVAGGRRRLGGRREQEHCGQHNGQHNGHRDHETSHDR